MQINIIITLNEKEYAKYKKKKKKIDADTTEYFLSLINDEGMELFTKAVDKHFKKRGF